MRRADAPARELADVTQELDSWTTRELDAIDKQLAARKMPPVGGARSKASAGK